MTNASFDELGMELVAGMEETAAAPAADTPFRIVLLGDFSGRGSRGLFDPGPMRPRAVDRDNLDELMAKLAVTVHLGLEEEGDALAITFAELDDFHPDRLYQRLDIFQTLRKLRSALQDPNTFDAAAGVVRSMFAAPAKATAKRVAEEKKPPPAPPQSGSLLDQVIAETTGEPVEPSRPAPSSADELTSFLGPLVAPHLVKELSGQEELIGAVDQAVSELMRAILHHPQFQEIEAAWRSVDFLVRRLETGDALSLYLIDLSREEFAGQLRAADDPRRAALHRLLVEQAGQQFGTDPWAAVIGLYDFAPSAGDLTLLHRMASLASLARAPFIAAARDSFLGTPSLAASPDPSSWRKLPEEETALWQALRTSPQASWLGLALPRLLLRLPYGEETDPVDTFAFEEFAGPPQHHAYLWGNPAAACAQLLGASFSAYGWQMRSALIQDLTRLPLHIFKDKGESRITPCAEVVLTERAAGHIMDLGFMPLLSFAGQDRARLGRFQSVSNTSPRLNGRWS